MSFPPRPPMGMPPMFMGMTVGMPRPLMSAPPGTTTALPFFNTPAPSLRAASSKPTRPQPLMAKPITLTPKTETPAPGSGPPVTVFVGNITERWPDAMIRQLLSTCGQVLNWKRVQGASGKLQGFGFCEFNGPDSGLRAVRLLHGLEVGDKKLVVKVDAKTNSVLELFKAERKKKAGVVVDDVKVKEEPEDDEEDYMDQLMKDADEQSKIRINIIFREFKSDLEAYSIPSERIFSEKEPTNKQQIIDKLHLLKLSSLEVAPENDDMDDEAMEEGKREIITREIVNFRENMKQEKQREEERKKIGRERREREREREERKKDTRNSPSQSRKDRDRRSPRGSRSPSNISSPKRTRSRSRDRRDKMDRDRSRSDRDRDRMRERERERDRDRDRERISRTGRSSRERERERSPPPAPHKPRYREREEEEEAVELKRMERKAREKEANYEERLRIWEQRELKKSREYKKEKEKLKRAEEDNFKEARRMKQFLEDYDDEKHDSKYYKGKELQKRLAERAKELEGDNKDRQKEREELEEMKLKLLTTNASNKTTIAKPNRSLLEKYKKPLLEATSNLENKSPTAQALKILKAELEVKKGTIGERLSAFASGKSTSCIFGRSNSSSQDKNEISPVPIEVEAPVQLESPHEPSPLPPKPISIPNSNKMGSFSTVNFSTSTIDANSKSPTSTTQESPRPVTPTIELSGSLKSLADTGFQLSISKEKNNTFGTPNFAEDNSRTSFGSPPSPGMPSPLNYDSREPDADAYGSDGSPTGSPNQDLSPAEIAAKKKKMDVKDVFNQEEEDDGMGLARKRKLVPLDYGEESKKQKREDKTQEDKKKHIKTLIDQIPTEKEDLFAYEIDWEMVDSALMEKRIRPWINKKIIEYIGEPEPTLVDFICAKVLTKSTPHAILEDVSMVLDEEAEVFVVKMWRLLVYEIEAKKYGISAAKPQ